MFPQTVGEWLSWRSSRRKWRRQWRDIRVLLVLVLMCVLCQVFGLMCGVVGYALQWLGILPDDAPSAAAAAVPDQVRCSIGGCLQENLRRFRTLPPLYKFAVMV